MNKEEQKRISRRRFLHMAGGLAAGTALAACQPQTVIVEKEIEKVVTQVVEVEREVTKIVAGTPVVEKVVETKVVEKVVTPTATPVPLRTEPVEIKVGSHWGGATGEAFQAMMDAYNAGPGAEDMIKAVYVTGGNDNQQITANRLAGTPIDTYNIGDHYAKFAAGTILALPDDDAAFIKEEFWPAWQEFAWYEGQCLGYPSEFNCCCLFYRKSWFEEAGLEPPKTPDEMREAAKALTREGGDAPRIGYTFGYDTWHSGAHFIANIGRLGGEFFQWEGDVPVSVDITQEAVDLAINYWLDMINDGSTNTGIMSLDPSWQNGMAAMSEEAGWFPLIILRDAGKEDIYEDMGYIRQPVYEGDPPFSRTYGRVMAIDSKTKHPQDVLKMLRTWTSAPDMPLTRHLVDYIGCAPAHKKYPLDTIEWSKGMVDAFANEIVPIATFDKNYKALSYSEIRAKVNPVMQGIMLGLNTIDELKALQPELETILKRYDGPRW